MTATNKRLLISESRGDSNRCISCRGKSEQHATYASHSSPRTLGVRKLKQTGERFQPNGYTATSVYWTHITSMRLIRSILAHWGQPIGP
jgi:hypothetical protein